MPALKIAVHDRQGLIWGYQLPAAQPLSAEELAERSYPPPAWLHFNLADSRARNWLLAESGLPQPALSVFLDAQPRVRLQVLPEGVVAILVDIHHEFQGDPEAFGDLRLFVDEQRVISARRHPLRTVDVLRHSLQGGQSLESTTAWLAELAHTLAATLGDVVNGVVDQADEIEDEIVAGHGPSQRGTLANIRRLLVRLRRHLNANRAALGRLPVRGSEGEQLTLRRALERLDGVAQDLDLVHERVRLLQEELAGLLAEATNRNLYVLSIVTTVLLPTTMVTGLWGMNVGGLPWADDPNGFAWAALMVVGSVLICLLLLRGSRVV